MKILTLCYEYPPLGGGAGRVAKGIAEALAGRGHEVRFLTGGMPHLPCFERIGGVDVYRVATGRRREEACSVFEMGLYLLASFLPERRQVRTWRPDVIHAHLAMPTGVLAWAARCFGGPPYVLTAHLGDVPGGVPEQTDALFKVAGPLARRVWREAAAATAVSDFVRGLAVEAYHRPVTKIFNGIDLTDAPATARPAHRPPRLIFIGRFSPQKNVLMLVEALASLRELDWSVTMIGDGDLRPAVRDGLAAAHLVERAELTGWLDATAVQTRLAEADILCMPSLSEGMPMAAMEALKAGVAIVATDIPGLREIAAHGQNALLVKPGSASEFAAALRSLVTDSDSLSEMKLASHRRASEFDLRSIAAEYENVLCSAMVKPF